MSTERCCQIAKRGCDTAILKCGSEAAIRERGGEAAAWIIPGATLALIPKCPACVAMYVALFSGASISMAGAAGLRISVMALCVFSLLFLALRRLRIFRGSDADSPASFLEPEYGSKPQKIKNSSSQTKTRTNTQTTNERKNI